MSGYTLNLNHYHHLENTNSCYLDGRYFQKVFAHYPGLIPNTLNIHINDTMHHMIDMHQCHIDKTMPGILRVVIETPDSRHSNLLILDYEDHKIHRFEPLGADSPYSHMINTLIVHYLGMYLGFDFTLEMVHLDEPLDEKSTLCPESGFCSAYVMLYAYDYLNGQDFDPTEIKKFSNLVESTYGPLNGTPDVEMGYPGYYYGNPSYGYNRPNPGGALAGGLTGGVLGGLALGPAGALAGGLGGAAIGSLL